LVCDEFMWKKEEEFMLKKEDCMSKKKIEIVLKENLILKNILTQSMIGDIQSGKLCVLSSSGQKVNLDDKLNGTVLLLAPLCGG